LRFAEATSAVIDALESEIETRLSSMATLEAAAQSFADILFETFVDATVLARAFVTVPLVRLPHSNQDFVRRLVGTAGEQLLRPHTPVLSLVGTRGVDPQWNSRHTSVGHVGIPLASDQFVDSVPMIARLLKELGASLEWADDLDTAIGAQEFVREHGVRTVFGFGGSYPVAKTFLAVVLFTRETVEKQQSERFMRLANSFKAATMRVALEGRIFDSSGAPALGTRAS
jgi:hypothetical protein